MSIKLLKLAQRLLAYLLAMELFGYFLEFTSTYTIDKQLPNGGIHIPTKPLVAVKDAISHEGWPHSMDPNLLDGTKSGQRVYHVMAFR